MRLLYVIDGLAPGGAETSLLEMTPGLVSGGIELHVLPLGNRVDLAPSLVNAGATVHARSNPSGSRWGNVSAVVKVARNVQPDLIHTTLFEADVSGRTAARLIGVPSSSSLVNDSYGSAHYAETSKLKLHGARALDWATAQSASRFHAITHAIAASVPPRIGIDSTAIDVIPRGRDPRRYQFRPLALRSQTRARLGILPEVPVILAVGRLDPQKGLDHLIRALPAVVSSNPNTVTLIAGKDGRSARALRAAADSVRANIVFLGHRTDVPDLLAAADVFCFPSEREGFGGVLVEAMAVGCPVVASSIPTSREVLGVNSGSAAAFVPVGNSDRLAQALIMSLANPIESAARARAARARFEEFFTIDKVASQMHAFFVKAGVGRR